MIDRFEHFSLAISEISRCWRRLAGEEMQRYGLRGPHATYLTSIYRHKNGITVPELCELNGKDLTEPMRENFYKSLDLITNNLTELTKSGIPE